MTTDLTGRALAAAVAERCFNLELCKYRERYAEWRDEKFVISERIPDYHENMGDAWQVAEWITAQGYHLTLHINSGYTLCEIHEDGAIFPTHWKRIVDENAPTAQEAICRAALKLAERMEQEANDG